MKTRHITHTAGVPDNILLHRHNGHTYALALIDGELVRASAHTRSGRSENLTASDFQWGPRLEVVEPQTGVETDPYDGTQFEPDPAREAYIVAARTMLETVVPTRP